MAGTKHGRSIVLAIKKYGDTAYTAVALLDDISGGGWTRGSVEVNGYAMTAIGKVFDSALMLKPMTLKGRLDPSQATQDEDTGLLKWSITNEVTTIELRGPNYSAPDTDMMRMSGQISDFTFITPATEKYAFETIFTPDGSDLRINGTTVVTQTI